MTHTQIATALGLDPTASQAAVARALGLSPQHYGLYLRAERPLDRPALLRALLRVGVSVTLWADGRVGLEQSGGRS